MNIRKILAAAMVLGMAAAMTGCGDSESSSSESSEAPETTAASAEPVEVEEPTEEELIPPTPVEASDPNAITFDEGESAFAVANMEDPDCAKGEIEIVEVMGNKMLRFTDDGSNAANGTVQKILIDAAKVLSKENVAKVRAIEMDVYADATANNLTTDTAENLKAPGWIGGGGGANVADEKWYDFSAWESGEYNFEMSGAIHVRFKFLLAEGGRCWNEDMDEATFQVMRWGAQNEGNFYIDNLVFLDADNNSLPIEFSAGSSEESGEEAETAEGETEAETEAEETEAAE